MSVAPTTLPPQLRIAVDALYETFAGYSATNAYSPLTSITEEDVRVIRSRPLRELSGKELGKFAMKALTTWGDATDFRHFLPRLLELVATDHGWTDVATLLGKLEAAEWRTWPVEEQRVVEGFLAALCSSILRGEVATSLASVALGASSAGIPLGPLLANWRNAGAAAVTQLAYLVGLERNSILKIGTVGSRWSDDAKRVLGDLLSSDETRKTFEETFFRLSDKRDAETVSLALGILETMPKQTQD